MKYSMMFSAVLMTLALSACERPAAVSRRSGSRRRDGCHGRDRIDRLDRIDREHRQYRLYRQHGRHRRHGRHGRDG